MRTALAALALVGLAFVGGSGDDSPETAQAASSAPRQAQAARPACRLAIALQGRTVLAGGTRGVQRLVVVNRGRRPATKIRVRLDVRGSASFGRAPSRFARSSSARRLNGRAPNLRRGAARRVGVRLSAARPQATAAGRLTARVQYTCGGKRRVVRTRRGARVLAPGLRPPAPVSAPKPTPPAAGGSNPPAPTPRPEGPVPGAPARFATLSVGTPLPSGNQCAQWVRSTPENRPENAAANRRPGPGIAPYGGQAIKLDHPLQNRVDGNFTGTTDELIQWASCKWGFDEDITRARVVAESYWKQSAEGDRHNVPERCQSFGKTAPCFESYGLLQVRPPFHPGTWPAARDSTAFNLDYAMAFLRVCFVGGFEWLGPQYRAGDEWGCVGTWFAGRWKTAGALDYNAKVQGHLRDKLWLNPTF